MDENHGQPTGEDDLSLSELARRVENGVTPSGKEAALIKLADELTKRSQKQLHQLVQKARQGGISWQVIGDSLGVSRQAAFRRFGNSMNGDKMPDTTINLLDRTSEIFHNLDAGDYESVRELMTYTCSRDLSKRKLMGVWDRVVQESGRLEACVDSAAQTPDGVNALGKFTNRHLLNATIVQTTLKHEAGDWMGRVAYNSSGKITGILIASIDAKNLPF